MTTDAAAALEAARAQLAGQTVGQPLNADPSQLGAQLAAGQVAAGQGLGATDVDAGALLQMIRDMQSRLDSMEAEKAAGAGTHPLKGTVESLLTFLKLHADPAAISLGEDLADAAGNALESGDVGIVTKIGGQLLKHLKRNAPPPGENYAYNQALDFAGPHLEDQVDGFTPPRKPQAAAAVTSDRAPAKVIAGNVTG